MWQTVTYLFFPLHLLEAVRLHVASIRALTAGHPAAGRHSLVRRANRRSVFTEATIDCEALAAQIEAFVLCGTGQITGGVTVA
jgi:hypothetical protein